MKDFTYSLNGQEQIVLTELSTTEYLVDPELQAAVRAAAQTRANNTGHVCEVFSHGGDVLDQVEPVKT